MVKKLFFSFIIITFILFQSCSKDPVDNSVNVRIVEFGTNKPLAGAEIVVRRFVSGGLLTNGTVPYDTVYTNENGYAFLDDKEYNPTAINVYSRDSNYFDMRHSGGFGSAQVHIAPFRKNPVFKFYPFAWVKLKVDDWDRVKGIYYRINTSAIDGASRMPFIIYKDTIFELIKTLGNRENTLDLFGYKHDGTTIFLPDDTVFVNAFDTIVHTIKFNF